MGNKAQIITDFFGGFKKPEFKERPREAPKPDVKGIQDTYLKNIGLNPSDEPKKAVSPEFKLKPKPYSEAEEAEAIHIETKTTNSDTARLLAPQVDLGEKKDTLRRWLNPGRESEPIITNKQALPFAKKDKKQIIMDHFGGGDIKLGARPAIGSSLEEKFDSGYEEDEGVFHKVLTALAIDEHLIARSLYAGKRLFSDGPETTKKKSLSDYNYTNMLIDMGMEDNLKTHGLGLAMSIYLSPLNYLTGFTKAGAQIGVKTFLSPGGVKTLKKISSKVTARTIKRLKIKEAVRLKKAGVTVRSLDDIKIPSKVIEEASEVNYKIVKKNMARHLGEMNDVTKKVDHMDGLIMKDLSRLDPKALRAKQGLRFELFHHIPKIGGKSVSVKQLRAPFSKVGKEMLDKMTIRMGKDEVIKGTEMLKVASDYLVPYTKAFKDSKGWDAFQKSFNYWYKKDKGMISFLYREGPDAVRYLNTKGMKEADREKMALSYIDAQFMHMKDDVERSAKSYFKFANKMFGSMSDAQRKEFSEIMIKATKNVKEKPFDYSNVTSLKGDFTKEMIRDYKKRHNLMSKDKVVQEAIDRYLGWVKGGSAQSKFLKRTKIMLGEELPLYYPTVIAKYFKNDYKYIDDPKGMGKHTKSRLDNFDDMKEYSLDPRFAIAAKLTNLAKDRLHQVFYNRIVSGNLPGTIKVDPGDYKKVKELKEKGWKLIPNPGLKNAFEEAEATGKKVKLVNSENAVISGDEIAVLNRDDVFVSPELYSKYSDNVYRETDKKSVILDFLEVPTKIYKTHLTVLHPAFHAVNHTTNTIYNLMKMSGHALDPRLFARALQMNLKNRMVKPKGMIDKTFNRSAQITNDIVDFFMGSERVYSNGKGGELTTEMIRKEIKEMKLSSTGMYMGDMFSAKDVDKTLSDTFNNFLREFVNPLGRRTITAAGAKFGTFVEDQSRAMLYFFHRRRGLSPQLAKEEVDATLHNYSQITKFEEKMNASIIPFYTFARKNLDAHMNLAMKEQGKIFTLGKLLGSRVAQDHMPTQDEYEALPEYMKKQFVMKVADMYFNIKTPTTDIIEMFSENPISRMNPIAQWVAEGFSGRKLRTNQELEEIRYANEFKPVLNLMKNQNAPYALRKFIEPVVKLFELRYEKQGPKFHVVGNPNRLWILRSLPSARYENAFQVMSRGDREGYEKALQLMTGVIKIRPDLFKEGRRTGRRIKEEVISKAKAEGHYWDGYVVGKGREVEEIRSFLKTLKTSKFPQIQKAKYKLHKKKMDMFKEMKLPKVR